MTQIARRGLSLGRVIAALSVTIGVAATLLLLTVKSARAEQVAAAVQLNPQLAGWAFMAAALSTALAALAAGYAVARVGSAAIGAIAEKPELFGRALVLVGLAEGIAIYGLIVSILILNRIS
ncbi:MAG: ATP synthase subunit C [Gammaproteobacteria bacterium]